VGGGAVDTALLVNADVEMDAPPGWPETLPLEAVVPVVGCVLGADGPTVSGWMKLDESTLVLMGADGNADLFSNAQTPIAACEIPIELFREQAESVGLYTMAAHAVVPVHLRTH
jgi:hypothetical protein